MNICGINKLTLMDFPQHTACILFVGGCNMRCPYCHNSGLVVEGQTIDQSEIDSYLTKRQTVLDGVVISGGEPTIYSDLPQYIMHIRSMGYNIKLDTNGTNPDMLSLLIKDKLVDYVAMDIKNSTAQYNITTNSNVAIDKVQQSIDILINSNVPHEFRTTVVEQFHNNQSFEHIGIMLKGAKNYYLQCYNDNGDTFDHSLTAPTAQQLEQYATIMRGFVDNVEIR